MDSKATSDILRKLSEFVATIPNDRLHGVAIIVPPNGDPPVEVVLTGSSQPGFAQYVIQQIELAAKQSGSMSPTQFPMRS